MAAGSTGDNPLDRALSAHIAGDDETALRWAVAFVKSKPDSPAGLFVTARVAGKLGAKEAAMAGLETCVTRSIDTGNLALAVGACQELEQLGADASPRLDAVAAAFAKGSRRIEPQGAAPPNLPAPDDAFQPVPDTTAGPALLAEATATLTDARAQLDREVDARGAPPPIRPLPLLSSLAASGLRAMVSAFHVEIVEADRVVIQQGRVGDSAYLVARGELEVRRDGDGEPVRLARLGNGTLFGEMALLSRSPRTASVVACRPSVLLVAAKSDLDRVAEKNPEIGTELAAHCHQRMVDNLVRTTPILKAVRMNQRPALMLRFATRVYEKGDRLIRQGNPADGLHLIASGEVSVVHHEEDGQTVITRLGPGDSVGEVALVLRRPANADVVAEHPTVTLRLPGDQFLAVIRQHPEFLAVLYELAVVRDEETAAIASQEATEVDDAILV